MPITIISSIDETNQGQTIYQPDEALVDLIWHDLGGQILVDQIRQTALEIAAEYQDATVTAYIPILIWRQVLERLRPGHAAAENR